MKILVVALFMCVAQLATPFEFDAGPKTHGLLLDPSKQYVYLKFDHVGARHPLSRDEDNRGLWLRLVNNFRISIVVAVFSTGTTDPGVGVYDEVVPLVAKSTIVRFGDKADTRSKPLGQAQEVSPAGYPHPDVFSTTIISPGESLLFSVPLSHVSPSWGMQIRFYLDIPGHSYGSGPYSVVSFDWQDIPERFRKNSSQ